MSQVPFFGVMLNNDGTYTDLYSGETVAPSEITVTNRIPFYGRFIDKDGYEHDLRTILENAGSGGGVDSSIIERIDMIQEVIIGMQEESTSKWVILNDVEVRSRNNATAIADLRAAFEAVPIDTTLQAVLDE